MNLTESERFLILYIMTSSMYQYENRQWATQFYFITPQHLFSFVNIIIDTNNEIAQWIEVYDLATYLKPKYINCTNSQERISISTMMGKENTNQEA